MHPTRRPRLQEVMAGLAAGDPAFAWALACEFGDELGRAVRRVLDELGRPDVLRDPGRVEGMVLDIALYLLRHGRGWRPDGGALPWVWAEAAIRAIVVRDVGHRSVEADDEHLDGPDPGGPCVVEEPTLVELARSEPQVALLLEALQTVTSERDRAVHLEYGIQRATGDPSPAVTVGASFGLKPDNVRQIDHRVRAKLRTLAADDERYRELGGLRWLA
jgi:hypothetical protein